MSHAVIPDLTDRQLRNFWLKVGKRGSDDCWNWSGSKHYKGYGAFGLLPTGVFRASRIMYYLATGKQPGPLMVCHTCDNTGCCNPAHFFLGTDADNAADKMAKGRHGSVKLTEAQVREIRTLNETGVALAAEYGVHRRTIYAIKRRESWKHI